MKIIITIAIATILTIGWGLNIYKLIKCDFEAPYKTEIIRGASVFIAPVAGVIGYVDIGEENE